MKLPDNLGEILDKELYEIGIYTKAKRYQVFLVGRNCGRPVQTHTSKKSRWRCSLCSHFFFSVGTRTFLYEPQNH